MSSNHYHHDCIRCYRIGDTVRVSIEPASYPDLRTLHGYPTTDFNGEPSADKRRFVMKISSRSGTLLKTVVGQALEGVTGSSKYVACIRLNFTPT